MKKLRKTLGLAGIAIIAGLSFASCANSLADEVAAENQEPVLIQEDEDDADNARYIFEDHGNVNDGSNIGGETAVLIPGAAPSNRPGSSGKGRR